jgi:hypothetical protein
LTRFEVTIFHDIGSIIVEATCEKEANDQVKLIDLFTHGYSVNLQKRVRKLTE